MSVDREYMPEGFGPGRMAQLRHELELAGVTLDLPARATLDAGLESGSLSVIAAKQLRRRAFDVLADGLSLSVSVGAGASRIALERVCDTLRLARDDAAAPPARIEIVVASASVSPFALLRLRNERLGEGVVHVLASPSLMQRTAVTRKRTDRFWRQLWQSRVRQCIRLAYVADVLPACSLLSPEKVNAVLPGSCIQVPAGSAWIAMGIDVVAYADRNGEIDDGGLAGALRRAVEVGDRLHDLVQWPTPCMRHDSWLNRRLGIAVAGFGDLLQRRGLDPRCFRSLEQLHALLQRVRDVLGAASRARALSTETVPALEQCDPCRSLPGGHRHDWHARWRRAVESSAVRHRNLLVMSPWALFPRDGPADYRYADLVPVLRHTDACAAVGAPRLESWNVNEFKRFHERVCAVLQQREV